ncbi:MAG: F0F1 ATP synthase subunit B [Syntrophobacterales bacterium]|nr:F0F1 ATP synthase subunit B [Syntrophobacterales bacterium]
MRKILKRIFSRRFLLTFFLPAVLFIILSAAFVYASGGSEEEGHHAGQFAAFAWKTLDFIILFAFLYWAVAKGVKRFFAGRRESIKESLETAIASKEDAKKKFDEYSAKLVKATSEIEEITRMITAQGEAEKKKIIEDAKRTAEKMKADARARIDQEFKRVRNQLRREAAELSVEMAETILKKKVKKNDHELMVKDFLDRMVILN